MSLRKFNFLSGTKAGMEVLLSIQGLKVIVIMECMAQGLICSGLLSSMFQKEMLAGMRSVWLNFLKHAKIEACGWNTIIFENVWRFVFFEMGNRISAKTQNREEKRLHIICNLVAIAGIFSTYSWCLRDFSTYTFLQFMNQ